MFFIQSLYLTIFKHWVIDSVNVFLYACSVSYGMFHIKIFAIFLLFFFMRTYKCLNMVIYFYCDQLFSLLYTYTRENMYIFRFLGYDKILSTKTINFKPISEHLLCVLTPSVLIWMYTYLRKMCF